MEKQELCGEKGPGSESEALAAGTGSRAGFADGNQPDGQKDVMRNTAVEIDE